MTGQLRAMEEKPRGRKTRYRCGRALAFVDSGDGDIAAGRNVECWSVSPALIGGELRTRQLRFKPLSLGLSAPSQVLIIVSIVAGSLCLVLGA